jgi:hypothetical protein
MGTNAKIIVKTHDNRYRLIHNQFDGYEEHLGKMLVEHFNDDASAQALADLGDVSAVNETLESTIAYSRDCGEDFARCCPRLYDSLDSIPADDLDYKYNYVWNGEEWERLRL